MSDQLSPQIFVSSTYAGRYLAGLVKGKGWPVITRYKLYLTVLEMYQSKDSRTLYLRSKAPSLSKFRNLTDELIASRTVSRIGSSQAFRVPDVPTLDRADALCLADGFCAVAYLTAMQRWNLTDRNPKSIDLYRVRGSILDQKLKAMVEEDAQRFGMETKDMLVKPVKSPAVLEGFGRDKRIELHQDNKEREVVTLRGTATRITTLPQTFVDMLYKPDLCGGMAHVIDVWTEHFGSLSSRHTADFFRLLSSHSPIVKVRAGYILDELLGVSLQEVEDLTSYAQRGGSRVLDPQKPFASTFSEKWMLSLNV